jgi:hypothetical protein
MGAQKHAGAAGDGLLHPLVLLALALLVLNDHVFKAAAAGSRWSTVTGKLSDVCGVFFLPVLLVAGLELAAALRDRLRRTGPVSDRVLGARPTFFVALFVAVFFALMKTVPAVGALYAHALGALQWPVLALAAAASGEAVPGLRPVRHVLDASDVVAVPFAFVVVWLQRQRAARFKNG